MSARVIVVGGSTMDVLATPSAEHALRRGSSVPGAVEQIPGGVGRNIAEAAARMLAPSSSASSSSSSSSSPPPRVALVSVVGDDAAGAALRASCAALPQLDCSGLATAPPGVRTPTVVAVLDPGGGELAACVADATATEWHLPARRVALELRRRLAAVASPAASSSSQSVAAASSVVVLDGNLSPEALVAGAAAVARAAAATAGAAAAAPPPAAASLFEPVSAPKAARGAAALPWLSYASPNAGELRALAACLGEGRLLRARLMSEEGGGPRPHAAAASAAVCRRRECWVAACRGRRDGGRQDGALPPSPPPPPDAVLRLLREALPDAAAVLSEGLGCLVLTLGEHGAALLTLHHPLSSATGATAAAAAAAAARGKQDAAAPSPVLVLARHVPALPVARPVSTSGAGDCLVAGFAVALSRLDGQEGGGAGRGDDGDDGGGDDAEVRALATGAAAAAAAVASASNVPGGGRGGGDAGALALECLDPLARGLARHVGVVVLPVPAGALVSRL